MVHKRLNIFSLSTGIYHITVKVNGMLSYTCYYKKNCASFQIVPPAKQGGSTIFQEGLHSEGSPPNLYCSGSFKASQRALSDIMAQVFSEDL